MSNLEREEVFCWQCEEWQPRHDTVLGMHRCRKCWVAIRPTIGINLRRIPVTPPEETADAGE